MRLSAQIAGHMSMPVDKHIHDHQVRDMTLPPILFAKLQMLYDQLRNPLQAVVPHRHGIRSVLPISRSNL